MQELVFGTAEVLGIVVEGAGILTIFGGLVISFIRATQAGLRQKSWSEFYEDLRKYIGRTLLLGLEFLLAAEIIRSIMIGETWEALAILGGIVLIRTFLSIAIDMEINGRWPWNASSSDVRDKTRNEVE